MIVAIQGQPGSFSEAAAARLAGDEELLHCSSFEALFDSVESGRAHRGVVPVRNSIVGDVSSNADRVRAFTVLGELVLPVRQCLIARPGTSFAALRSVASHPVALQQCSRFFASNPQISALGIADTGSGVRDLMRGTLQADAAIGSEAAAERYGAAVLIDGVDDSPTNATTFVLIERTTPPATT